MALVHLICGIWGHRWRAGWVWSGHHREAILGRWCVKCGKAEII